MRQFVDGAGMEWTAVLGRASYGEMMLLFSRRGTSAVYESPLEAATAAEGDDLLRTLADEVLRERLAQSIHWCGEGDH